MGFWTELGVIARTLEAVDPTSPTASTRALPEVTMQPDSDEASKVAMMMVRMMLSPSAIPWLSRSRMAQVAGIAGCPS
jgi:hypothetical protein